MASASGSSQFLPWTHTQWNSDSNISSCPQPVPPFCYDHLANLRQAQAQAQGEGEVLGIKGTGAFCDGESGVLQRFQQQQLVACASARPGLLLDRGMVDKLKMNMNVTAQKLIDAKALAASKSHSEAERRRRERINNHLATLRTLLPSTTKTDKASLLAEVIEHVKYLKRQASQIQDMNVLPTETDEITVDTVESSNSSTEKGKALIRATVCCEDRPELMSDIITSLRPLGLRTLKAEITTMGGRVKNVLLLLMDCTNTCNSSSSHDPDDSIGLSSIHDALKSVLERPSNANTDCPAAQPPSKRQRFHPFASIIQDKTQHPHEPPPQYVPSFVYA